MRTTPLAYSRFRFRSAAIVATAVLAACGGGSGGGGDPAPTIGIATIPDSLPCDDRLKTTFRPDAATTVLLVKAYRQGEAVALSGTATSPAAPIATVDTCLVKLMVGPGNPGTPGAPSTSAGIGIEVWLPATLSWNQRIRAYGSGGWAGGVHASTTLVQANRIHLAAVGKGYVVGISDHGHQATGGPVSGAFAMREDGGINTVLWQDFAERSLHELALKTKALTAFYYQRPHLYAYWDGFSTGGRQGYKLAQKYPEDFDGILAGAPAFNWTKFITAELYPQVLMERALGGVIPVTKLNAVSASAVGACGGGSLGFLLDPLRCAYDPTKDASALCSGEVGFGGIGGLNNDPTKCVTLEEAAVINKIWYGQTADGTAEDPAVLRSASPTLASSNHLWWGLARGTTLGALAGANPFPIATDMAALALQNPRIAQPAFLNATANGANQWKSLDYAGLANVAAQGLALQSSFANINTDSVDLRALRDRGAKVLSYHGLADELIMPQGSINYYTRLAAFMGGATEVNKFNRLFLIPGYAHDSTFARSGSLDPVTGAVTSSNKVPLPQPATGRDELFVALRAWVEEGRAPSRLELGSADTSVTLPICPYPQKATYKGVGSETATSSYDCL